MNDLAILNQTVKTMSSREIATLCEKEHGHVCRDIETMFQQIGIDPQGYIHFWKHPQNGQRYREFQLDKDLTLTLVSGYNANLRYRIIQRWQELENQQPQIPQTYAQALRAYADEVEQRQALQIENQAMKPKVESWERFIDADGLLPSGAIGKLLGFNSAQEFNKAIKEKRVAFKANDGSWQFYADFKDKDIGKMVAWERGEYNKAGLQLKWRTRAVEYFSKLFSRSIQEVV